MCEVPAAQSYERQKIMESKERRMLEMQQMNLFSNEFLSVALADIPACQHVLRILTGMADLKVVEVRTQYRVSKIASHDAILDVLAEDRRGKLYNVEIQRADTIDHARRTRFYGAMLDSEYLQKGKSYDEMPDVHIIYVSETDLWKAGETVYPVKKYFGGIDMPYDDGISVLYVNAEVNDGSDAAKLMEYFRTADPDDRSQGDLSDRVHFLKCEEGGFQIMCEITEKWLKEGIEIGKMETAVNLAKMGFTVDKIAQAVQVSASVVKQWLEGNVSTIQ